MDKNSVIIFSIINIADWQATYLACLSQFPVILSSFMMV